MGSSPLLVIDDHPIFRAGMVAALARLPEQPTVLEAGSFADGWRLLWEARPACATVDLELKDGNGLELLRMARARSLPTRFVVVSLYDDALFRDHALSLGASAYVTKAEDEEHVVAAVVAALAQPATTGAGARFEEPPLPALPGKLLEGVALLSPAERRVMQHLAQNLTSAQIAERLQLSRRTVQNHRAHICEKLGLRGNNKLLEVALSLRGVLGAPDDEP